MGKIVPFDLFIGFLSSQVTPEPEKEKVRGEATRQKKKGKKLIIISIIVFILLIVGGIGGYLWLFSHETSYTPQFPGDFNWVDIQPGTFIMGNSNGSSNQNPPHQITISKGFQMLRFEVTQGQWEAVMGEWDYGSYGRGLSAGVGENHPAYRVSWNDCQSFISKLNELDSNYTYRLPTEAEWEYCCRAGRETDYSFGDDEEKIDMYAWYGLNSKGKTHPVGEKLPNAWGLYDMHGNVCEWCQDWYDKYYYENSTNNDPQGPTSGSNRVFRGSDWNQNDVKFSFSSRRNGDSPDAVFIIIGFRLVREEK